MIRFSKDYSKLSRGTFATIRKVSNHYAIRSIHTIKTPTRKFKAQIIAGEAILKKNITDGLARLDADCSRSELIAMLEKWYGKSFDDFVLLTLERIEC